MNTIFKTILILTSLVVGASSFSVVIPPNSAGLMMDHFVGGKIKDQNENFLYLTKKETKRLLESCKEVSSLEELSVENGFVAFSEPMIKKSEIGLAKVVDLDNGTLLFQEMMAENWPNPIQTTESKIIETYYNFSTPKVSYYNCDKPQVEAVLNQMMGHKNRKTSTHDRCRNIDSPFSATRTLSDLKEELKLLQ